MLFQVEDIRSQISTILPKEYRFETHIEYGQFDFMYPADEKGMHIIIGSKQFFPNTLTFWIKSFEKILISEERNDTYEPNYHTWFDARCSAINQKTFHSALKDLTRNLKHSVDILPNGITQYILLDDWNERVLLIENKEYYQLIYWDTTA